MRLFRLRMANFRGVKSREVSLEGSGVTIIEGCNEVGKSSLAEAIDLVFEELDSSGKQRVRDVKPVDSDVGPEVEVEVEVGPYHLIYSKRWLKQPQTLLRQLAPEQHQYAGRDAHNRMEELLREHLDVPLWKALRYQQGQAVGPAALAGSRSLQAALDAAAGRAHSDGGQAEDLWSRVEAERRRYFTPGGQPNKERKDLADRLAEGQAQLARAAAELQRLEEAVAEHDGLIPAVGAMKERIASQRRAVERAEEADRAVGLRIREADRLALEAERAEGASREAVRALQDRAALVERCSQKANEARDRAGRLAGLGPALAAAEEALSAKRALLVEAGAELEAAEAEERSARADVEHLEKQFSLETLEERQARVREAEPLLGEAEAFLEGCLIDPAKLEEIESAHLAVAEARARRQAESATVRIEAIGEVDVAIGGHSRRLVPGEVVETVAGEQVEVMVPQQVRVVVTGGPAARDLGGQVDAAEQRLAVLYAVVGVGGEDALDRARGMERRRSEMLAAKERAVQVIGDNLRDLTPGELAEKIDRARDRLAALAALRPAGAAVPASHQAAEAAADQAAARVRRAREAADERRSEAAEAEENKRQAETIGREERFLLARAENEHAVLSTELAAARLAAEDEALAETARTKEEAARSARTAQVQAAAAIGPHEAETAEALLRNERAVLERFQEERHQAEERLAALNMVLQENEGVGLQDAVEAAGRACEGLERQQASIERRAAAALLLSETMGRHREAAKARYVAPFRAELERLGAIVFEAPVSIELSPEDLSIVARTLEGVTVPYESLSVGAKEQLSLLSRLAGAMLVGRDGAEGIPVIIDDALGNSDAARLKRLGAVLRLAGEQTQVIVLTCVPERYGHVGAARVIRLEGTGPQAALPGPSGEGEGAGQLEAVPPITGPGPFSGGGPPAARIINALRSSTTPLGRSEIIARADLPPQGFSAAMRLLLEEGRVVKQGAKRGTRYRLA